VKDPTHYCVQAYVRRDGRLTAEPVRWCASARAARDTARKLGLQRPAVRAYAFEGQPEYGVFGEPRLLACYGDLEDVV
jgi:hypothetical protein